MKHRILIFKVSLDNDIFRIIEVKENTSLHGFAEIILSAFEFDMDSAFGFYSNLKGGIYDSDERYELFSDIPGETTKGVKGVENELIGEVFSSKKKMTFLFDYRDEWHFLVECLEISETYSKITYPRKTQEEGISPPQYLDKKIGGWS